MSKRSRHKKSLPRELIEIPVPLSVRGKVEPGARAYRLGECTIFVGRRKSAGWHISISHPTRYPTWDEIKYARYKLLPQGLMMAMYLPPEEQYLNVDVNCFHLFEIVEQSRMVQVKDPTGKILGMERRK